MDKINIIKLHRAGYRFIRKDESFLQVKQMTFTGLSHGWKVIEKFTNRGSLDKRFNELMKDEKTLQL